MKNIALIRTSTIKQEVESQKKEIENAIKKNNEKEIVFIGGAGASAIKLDEIYLANIQTVYDTMERGDVVWAWAIDRIGRNEEILMGFKNRLIKEGVNLVILNPSLTLLNPDGTVNAGVELAFSLFSTMAKQEMEMKKERFKRAKKRNREDGLYLGGPILWGYKVNPNTKKYEIDETKPVHKLFYEYAHTPISSTGLAIKYKYLFPQNKLDSVSSLFRKVLRDKNYLGDATYPRIVSDEIFSKVQQKKSKFRMLPKYHYNKAPYWCHGIIFQRLLNGETYAMHPEKHVCSYTDQHKKICVNINAVDSLVFHLLQRVFDEYNPAELIEEINAQNAQIEAKKEALQKELEKLFEKDRELDERYFIAGTVKNYDGLKNALQIKIKNLQIEINDLQPVKTDIERPTLDGLNDWEIQDVIRRYINAIYIMRIEDDKPIYKIDVITTLNIDVSVTYRFTRKNGYEYRLPHSPEWKKINVIRKLPRVDYWKTSNRNRKKESSENENEK